MMVESISAVTLATHDMARAVQFYRMLGFERRVATGTTSQIFVMPMWV